MQISHQLRWHQVAQSFRLASAPPTTPRADSQGIEAGWGGAVWKPSAPGADVFNRYGAWHHGRSARWLSINVELISTGR